MSDLVHAGRRTAFLAGIALGFGTMAHATDKNCSRSTLDGAYGYTVTGVRPAGVPFAAVGRIVFNGRGGVTTKRTLSDGGTIVRGDTGSGTYTVGNDCTGSFSIVAAGLGQLNVDIVIDDEGDQIRGIVTNSGFVLTLEGRKQDK